jgi:hypothetical protein
MKPDIPREEFTRAAARSSAERLEDLRRCHDAISQKQRDLMNAANRGDLASMELLNAELVVLAEVAAECAARILAATRPPR